MDTGNPNAPDFIHTFIYSLVVGKHFIINTNNNTPNPASIDAVVTNLIEYINCFSWIKYRILDCNSQNKDYFAQELKSLEQSSRNYIDENSTNNVNDGGNKQQSHEILIIIPSFLQTTDGQNTDGVKIAYFLQCLTKINKSVANRNGQTFNAICISNMSVLYKNPYLFKQFWLSCSMESFLNQYQLNDPKSSTTNIEALEAYYSNFVKTWSSIRATAGNVTYFYSPLRQYILDIVIHLRVHRFSVQGKGGGVQTTSLNDMVILSKLFSITPYVSETLYVTDRSFDETEYIVTPDLVKRASFWYFPFKLQLSITKEHMEHTNFIRDPSILYGGDPDLIDDLCNKLEQLNVMKQTQHYNQHVHQDSHYDELHNHHYHHNRHSNNNSHGHYSDTKSIDSNVLQSPHNSTHLHRKKDYVSQDEADFFLQQLVVKDVLNNVIPPF